MPVTKIVSACQLASQINGVLDKFASGMARVAPEDFERLSARAHAPLLEMMSLLRREREEVFEAFLEWIHEDAGGDTLMNAIPNCIGYHDYLKAREEQEPS